MAAIIYRPYFPNINAVIPSDQMLLFGEVGITISGRLQDVFKF